MRPSPPAGLSRGSARGGVAPALLLDVQTPTGETFYWSDRSLIAMLPAIPSAEESTITLPPDRIGGGGGVVESAPPQAVNYIPWIVGAGTLKFYRSLQTDTGTVTLQNLSGDVLTTDFQRIVRRSTLEGSLYVLRYYSVDMQWAWIEQHGTLSCGDAGPSVQLNLTQLFGGSDDTPDQQVSETCQLNWGYPRCGATGDVECLYTYASCQVPDRFVGIQTAFEVNNPAAVAALATTTFNRARAF